MYPGLKLPVIPGSDGAGTVISFGPAVDDNWNGRDVIINPGWNWGKNERTQGSRFRILGMPDDGTFATHAVVPARYLHLRPEHLNWHEAAALPLAAVTAWRALFTQGQLQQGQNVLVNGVGGGVAGYAMQFAATAGANVYVTSSSEQKRDKALGMGIVDAFDYSEKDWHKSVQRQYGLMDLIVDGAGGPGYQSLIDLAGPGGRIVSYGATNGPPPEIDLFKVFWKQLSLVGSTMGSPADFADMLGFVTDNEVGPIIDEIFPLITADKALNRMASSRQFGKIVLDMI
jgi:NADPH:quinone reductase-like Zn-dependent oxidoreductase